MDNALSRLLDCGHTGELAGICQYERCATRMCAGCIATCESCGRVLCRQHQRWVNGRRQVFCPADVPDYFVTKLALKFLFGR